MSDQVPYSIPQHQAHIGDALVRDGLLNQAHLDEALSLQARWGTRLGDILLAKGWVRAYDFYRTLSSQFKLPFVDLLKSPPDESLFAMDDLDHYAQSLYLPWKLENGALLVAIADPSEAMLAQLRACYGESVQFVITSKFDIIWNVQRVANARLTDKSVLELARLRPEQSARQVFTGPQLQRHRRPVACGPGLPGAVAGRHIDRAQHFAVGLLPAQFRPARRADLGRFAPLHRRQGKRSEVPELDDHDLPVYTILVPMYKEPDKVPSACGAAAHGLPASKLEVKLVLEEDDTETIEAAKALRLPGTFEIVRVPPSNPRPSPRPATTGCSSPAANSYHLRRRGPARTRPAQEGRRRLPQGAPRRGLRPGDGSTTSTAPRTC